ncbi:MAG: hypothetical protein AAGF77_04455 [Bacteroidota bacterium]
MKQKKKKTIKVKPIAIITVIGLLVFLTIWFIKPYEEAQDESILVKGEVEYIRCQIGSKGSRSLIKVNYEGRLYNLPITKSRCKELKEGDTIQVAFIEKEDKIFIK